ncbi:MAG: hypothetical protein Q4P72_03075 [Eubacteriales bacterium]|nr:hypothetical protein [Eubacteriales bacterium]
MKKSFKLYSLNPFLAIILLLASFGVLVHNDGIQYDASMNEWLIDPSYAEYYECGSGYYLHQIDVDHVVCYQILGDEYEVHYEVVEDSEDLILNKLGGEGVLSTERPVNNRRIAHIIVYRIPDSLYSEENRCSLKLLTEIEHEDSEIWMRLSSHQDSYFHILDDGDRLHLNLIPESGLSLEEVSADDAYLLFDYNEENQLNVKFLMGAQILSNALQPEPAR